MKRIHNILPILVALVAMAASACSRPVAEKTTVPAEEIHLSRSSFSIGDTALLTIKDPARFATTEELTQNEILPTRQWLDTIDGTVLQRTVLTSFEEGPHTLKLTTDDSLTIEVADVDNVDTTRLDIRDIASTLDEPVTFDEVLPWLLSILAAVALIGLLTFIGIRIYQRRKADQPILGRPQAPAKPADQRALDSLEVLRQKQLWQQGKHKAYHTELTDILRRFLEECYSIPSTEMTSDQTLDAFCDTKVCSEETRSLLAHILQTADMVKFAKSEPLPHEHDRSMADAKAFVISCKEASYRLAANQSQPQTESKS